MELEKGMCVYWRHRDGKTFSKSYIRNIISGLTFNTSSMLLELSEGINDRHNLTIVLASEIIIEYIEPKI